MGNKRGSKQRKHRRVDDDEDATCRLSKEGINDNKESTSKQNNNDKGKKDCNEHEVIKNGSSAHGGSSDSDESDSSPEGSSDSDESKSSQGKGSDSDESDSSNDSDPDVADKSKKRKRSSEKIVVNNSQNLEEESESENDSQSDEIKQRENLIDTKDEDSVDPNEDVTTTNSSSSSPPPITPKKKTHLTLSEVENYNAKMSRRGVLYVARVPPRMGPGIIKSLLSPYGDVTRVYLVAEDKSARKRRQRMGGSGRGVRYTEGWVEFAERKVAKRVAAGLNNAPITNKKGSTFYGDLWSVKFLRKFEWSHLTEKVAYERRVREYKVRMEMMQAKRENAAFVSLVEKGQKMDMVEQRRRKKGKIKEGESATLKNVKRREYKQIKPMRDDDKAEMRPVLKSLV